MAKKSKKTENKKPENFNKEVEITTSEGIEGSFNEMLRRTPLVLIKEQEFNGKLFGTILNAKGQRLRIPKLNYELKTKKK
jgi:hypothetical protein